MTKKDIFWIDNYIRIWYLKEIYDCKNLLKYRWIQKYLINFFRDVTLPSLVLLYYKQSYKHCFLSFLKHSNILKYIHKNIIFLIKGHIKTIQDIVECINNDFKNIDDIEIIWDVHWKFHTKISITSFWKQFVITWNNFFSDNIIINLSTKILNTNLSWLYIKKWNFYYRDFIAYSNNITNRNIAECFYGDLWKKLAFLSALRSIDLHYENMLISDNNPYIFDFECILYPSIINDEYSLSIAWILNDTWWEDFTILSWWRWNRMSLLTPMLTSIWRNPKIFWTSRSKRKMLHIPESYWKKINPYIFRNSFNHSFNETIKKIIKNRKEIENTLINNKIYNRILIRPTRVYYAIIRDFILEQSVTDNSIDYKEFFYNQLIHLPIIPNIEKTDDLINSEIECLKVGVIPSFYSEIHEKLLFNSNEKIVSYLYETCFSVEKQHLDQLDNFILK